MNPYLEQSDTWTDFHDDFIVRIRETLSDRVGPNYLVKLEMRLILHERSAAATIKAQGQPSLGFNWVEKHRSIEILDRRDRRIVTVIELLSPSNKTTGEDRDDYMVKRRQILSSPTHLVEIDLRRGGTRPSPPQLPPCDYYVLVSRRDDRPRVGVWPFGLRDPMPTIPIPLTAPDAPVLLDLKAVLNRSYDAGGYGKYIYEETPEPPLTEDDAEWAREIVPERGSM